MTRDPSFAPPATKLLAAPLGELDVAAVATPGQGLPVDVNGIVDSSVIALSPGASLVPIHDGTRYVAGQIADAQVSSTAALGIAKLAGYPSDATKFLRGDATWAVVDTTAFTRVYDRATTTVDINTDATEKSIYTKSITGNDMSTNKMLRLVMVGDYLHNNVAGDSIRVKVKFGGTTFFDDTDNVNAALIATRQPWVWEVWVANLGATNSQMISTRLSTVGGTPATAGIGSFADVFRTGTTGGGHQGGTGGISTLGTIDTTTAKTLDITVQWSASSANNSWRMRYAVLELV